MIAGQPAPTTTTPDAPYQEEDATETVTIDAVVALLRDDRMRGFRIDVETDQLVENDQQIEKQRATEFITAVGQFLGAFGPMVEQMPMIAPMVGGLLNFAVKRFKTGRELEEVIEQTMAKVSEKLGNPAPPQPSPEDQAKIAQAQANLQATQIKAQAEHDKAQIDAQVSITKAQAEQEGLLRAEARAQAEHERAMQMAEQKHQHELAMMAHEAALAQAEHDRKLQMAEHQHRQKVEQAEKSMEQSSEAHDQSMEHSEKAHKQSLEAAKAKKAEKKSGD